MAGFDYFVVLADRRTGSNFLEANLNALEGVTCHGEAFNPNFIGFPKVTALLGMSQSARDAAPQALIDQIKSADGLNGFRYFGSHDPRVIEGLLSDPRCAKIVLTRDPVDSFVSLEIARATNQWMLRNVSRRRSQKITFDPARYETHVSGLQATLRSWTNSLKRAGQTAFFVDYEDLQSVDVMNGIAAYLGVKGRLTALDTSLKRQNPEPLSQKVENFDEMQQALAMTRGSVADQRAAELGRGAAVPKFVAAPHSPLLYLPIPGGLGDIVADWLAELDDQDRDALVSGFTQRTLRDWKRARPGHRSFTVVRHPVARAYDAFREVCEGRSDHAKAIAQTYDIPTNFGNDVAAKGAAFLRFLQFAKANLSGQTNIPTTGHWSTQAAVLHGFGDVIVPDMVMREDRLSDDLAILAATVGKDLMPQVPTTDTSDLRAIYTADIESAAKAAYQRDYDTFGFGPYA